MYTFVFLYLLPCLVRISLDHNLKKTYLILETLQAVAGGKKCCSKRYILPVTA